MCVFGQEEEAAAAAAGKSGGEGAWSGLDRLLTGQFGCASFVCLLSALFARPSNCDDFGGWRGVGGVLPVGGVVVVCKGGSMSWRVCVLRQSQLATDTPDIIDLLPIDGSAGHWATSAFNLANKTGLLNRPLN